MKKTLTTFEEASPYKGFEGGADSARRWRVFEDARHASAHDGKPHFVYYSERHGWVEKREKPTAEIFWEVMGSSIFCCEPEAILPHNAVSSSEGASA